MSRTQLYLAGLLGVQVVLLLIFHAPFSATTGHESRPLLPVLEAVTPTLLEIEGADEEKLRLVRRDDGWGIESLGGFPADDTKIDALLDELKGIRVRRPVVSSGRYLDSFKVADDDHEARLRLWADAAGDPAVDLIVGSSPNFRTCHVRLAGEKPVYEVRGLSPYDLRPATSGWIERDLVDADPARLVSLKLSNASGSFELARDGDGWKLASPAGGAGRALDPAKVESFVQSAAALRLDDAAGPLDESAQGLAAPAATLVLRWTSEPKAEAGTEADVEEATVRVGGTVPDGDSRRFVTRDGFPFAGTVWDSSVRRLIEETVDSLAAS
jgi:hypothetical protein